MAQLFQNVQQDKGIFSSGNTDHDPVSFANHLKILNGASGLASKSLAEFLFINRLGHGIGVAVQKAW